MAFNSTNLAEIKDIAIIARKIIEDKYGKTNEAMMGKCIEASDLITMQLQIKGYRASGKQVWCLYENFEGCSDYCFEEHWITLVESGKDKLYIDVTMNQFQWAFSKKLPRIYLNKKLPNFYLTRKPGKTTLDKCGWNDWYNYGDYINNFDYWG